MIFCFTNLKTYINILLRRVCLVYAGLILIDSLQREISCLALRFYKLQLWSVVIVHGFLYLESFLRLFYLRIYTFLRKGHAVSIIIYANANRLHH
jgi:hypothetical protein